ncbi:alpha/beta hydrolase [Amycolatopsis sp. FDAARGOS 1241]|uniref:alpha/beta hydrolase n=1 Tax=Amycolatopsis sp. FDAARGOS 1241 TaxID=2778070 RepID=UPI00194E809C|nr:alpha/beta hydrolase [Amycolatopsis sp. FDAARGOS 1241]QRP48229.1 alpha/beta hydrolase [Amycolatopsis sp. FDAARGOS 1241]
MPEVVLEPEAEAVAAAASAPPFLFELGPKAARKVLVDLQSGPIAKPEVAEQWVTVPAAAGDVRVRLVRPAGATGALPVVVYLHGGGWILGNALTHDRLVRELATGARATIAFVEYTHSPEVRYPVALEQGYATAQWITAHGAEHGLDAARLAVAGDSAGGALATALTLLAKDRGDVHFVHQSLYYPVTDAAMDTGSYAEFATGFSLTREAMEWFWDAYAPGAAQRADITASPNRATRDQLAGLPPAFVLVAEADVLRDEGESYAANLRAAGVRTTTVRYAGVIHDFMVLNSLAGTRACRGAVAQAAAVLREALGTGLPKPADTRLFNRSPPRVRRV